MTLSPQTVQVLKRIQSKQISRFGPIGEHVTPPHNKLLVGQIKGQLYVS